MVITAGWAASTRTWEAPQPEGLLSIAAARVLYGSSWSLLLASEVAAARALTGPRWRGLTEAQLSIDWLVGFEVPGPCKSACIGLGGMNDVRVKLEPWLEYGLGGGWIVGQVADDANRTLAESTWMLSPMRLVARTELELGPISLQLGAGPMLAFGLHDAHLHPKSGRGSLIELLVRDGGIGPGLRAEVRLRFFERVSLEAEAEAAVLLGASDSTPLEGLLDPAPGGLLSWRSASAGVGLWLPALDPIAVSLRLWLAELSTRALDRLGHRAVLLRFVVPLPLPGDRDQ
jgi:hypothetical protein